MLCFICCTLLKERIARGISVTRNNLRVGFSTKAFYGFLWIFLENKRIFAKGV